VQKGSWFGWRVGKIDMGWVLEVAGSFPSSTGDKGCGSPESWVSPSSVGMVVAVMILIDSRQSSAEDVPKIDHCSLMARASIVNVVSRIEEYSSSEYGYSSEIWRALLIVVRGVGVDVMVQIFCLFFLLFILPPPFALGLHS
jgi:hypothetical protein